jgi:hypothetical protein
MPGESGDIPADPIAQRIAGAFHRGPPQQANASAVPFRRRHAVDADVVGIGGSCRGRLLDLVEVSTSLRFGPCSSGARS